MENSERPAHSFLIKLWIFFGFRFPVIGFVIGISFNFFPEIVPFVFLPTALTQTLILILGSIWCFISIKNLWKSKNPQIDEN